MSAFDAYHHVTAQTSAVACEDVMMGLCIKSTSFDFSDSTSMPLRRVVSAPAVMNSTVCQSPELSDDVSSHASSDASASHSSYSLQDEQSTFHRCVCQKGLHVGANGVCDAIVVAAGSLCAMCSLLNVDEPHCCCECWGCSGLDNSLSSDSSDAGPLADSANRCHSCLPQKESETGDGSDHFMEELAEFGRQQATCRDRLLVSIQKFVSNFSFELWQHLVFCWHQKDHFSPFDGKLQLQCIRNGLQNLPYYPGSLQNTFIIYSAISHHQIFQNDFAKKTKSRDS